MLNAVGVYALEKLGEGTGLKKIKFVQQDNSMFFQKNQLENIDRLLFKELFYKTMESGKIYEIKEKIKEKEKEKGKEKENEKEDERYEYNYLHISSATDNILAISSITKLDPKEAYYLFTNIEHILIRPDKVKAKLEYIIANPWGYSGRDLLIDGIKREVKVVNMVMCDNLTKATERGRSLEVLKHQTIHLGDSAIKFEDTARKMNSCCWY